MATLTKPETKRKGAADRRAPPSQATSAASPIDWNASADIYNDGHERALNYIADGLLADTEARPELLSVLSRETYEPHRENSRVRQLILQYWAKAAFHERLRRNGRDRPAQEYINFIISDDIASLHKELSRRVEQGHLSQRQPHLLPLSGRDQAPGLEATGSSSGITPGNSSSSGTNQGNGNNRGGGSRGADAGQDMESAGPSDSGKGKKQQTKRVTHHEPPLHINSGASESEDQIRRAIDNVLRKLELEEQQQQQTTRAGFEKSGTTAHELKMYIHWEVGEYVKYEMHPGQTLGDMLVVTGETIVAWITSCREYVAWLEPVIGPKLLEGIEKCMGQSQTHTQRRTFFVGFGENYSITLTPYPAGLEASIWAPGNKFFNVVRTMAWFAATFRPIHGIGDLFASDITCKATRECTWIDLFLSRAHGISGDTSQLQAGMQESCWTSLYRGIHTTQFPVPGRWHTYEVGAQLSFEQMLALAGVQYPIFQENAIAFRGFRSVLYPVSLRTHPADPGRKYIQWHVVASDTFDDAAIEEALASIKSVPNWDIEEIEELKSAIHYLGYSVNANVRLGTAVYAPQKPDDRSGAVIEKSKMFFQKKVVLNFGTSGMGIFGAGGAVEAGWTKSLRSKLEPGSNLDLELAWSAKRFLLLYDVAHGTAWLVPELSVVLHLALSWIALRDDLAAGELSKLPAALLKADGGAAALDCINKNHAIEFTRKWSGKSWKFIEVIGMFLRFVKACRDTKDEARAVQARAWYKMGMDSPRIYGWDLADLVAGEQTAYRQEVTVMTNKSDKWITGLAHHPKMLTLFGSDMISPILPESATERCFHWDPPPNGMNWLVSTSVCLQQMMRSFGGSAHTGQIADRLYLRTMERHKPFDPCKRSRRCRRLHEIATEPQKISPDLPLDGAVVLGKSKNASEPCKAKPQGHPRFENNDKQLERSGFSGYRVTTQNEEMPSVGDINTGVEEYGPRSRQISRPEAGGSPSPVLDREKLSGSTLNIPTVEELSSEDERDRLSPRTTRRDKGSLGTSRRDGGSPRTAAVAPTTQREATVPFGQEQPEMVEREGVSLGTAGRDRSSGPMRRVEDLPEIVWRDGESPGIPRRVGPSETGQRDDDDPMTVKRDRGFARTPDQNRQPHRLSAASERPASAISSISGASAPSDAGEMVRRPSQQRRITTDFDEECRLLVVALCERRKVEGTSVDVYQLIAEGKALHAQLERQRSLLSSIQGQVNQWAREGSVDNRVAASPQQEVTIEEVSSEDNFDLYE